MFIGTSLCINIMERICTKYNYIKDSYEIGTKKVVQILQKYKIIRISITEKLILSRILLF